MVSLFEGIIAMILILIGNEKENNFLRGSGFGIVVSQIIRLLIVLL